MADCDLIVHKPVVQRLQEDGTLIWLGLGAALHTWFICFEILHIDLVDLHHARTGGKWATPVKRGERSKDVCVELSNRHRSGSSVSENSERVEMCPGVNLVTQMSSLNEQADLPMKFSRQRLLRWRAGPLGPLGRDLSRTISADDGWLTKFDGGDH